MKVKVIENSLFYLLLFFLPTQLGRHFWPNFSTIYGLRIDYLSPTIYFTDILIFLLLAIAVFEKVKTSNINTKKYRDIFQCKYQTSNKYQYLTRYWEFILLLIFLLVGIFFSKNPLAGLYGLLKILEFVFLGIYISVRCRENAIQIIRSIVFIFSLGILFESLLAILQFVNQGSLNGLFYFLGERRFTGQTPGIANASMDGRLILRPYGTLPHPNVLAGYLLIGMTTIIFNFKFLILNYKRILAVASVIVGSVALFLTMSRVAILLWLLIVIFIGVFYLQKKLRIRKLSTINFQLSTFLLVVLVFIGSIFLSPLRYRFSELSLSSETVVIRADLIKSSISMFSSNPVFGVGVNNFLVNLFLFQKPQSAVFYFQPVHNIYFLVLAETGIIGFSFFIYFLLKTYQRIRNYESCLPARFAVRLGSTESRRESRRAGKARVRGQLILFLLIIALGFFDHYFLTLQQGQLLFAFVMGFCWSLSKR